LTALKLFLKYRLAYPVPSFSQVNQPKLKEPK
jgi:hypothetical protein